MFCSKRRGIDREEEETGDFLLRDWTLIFGGLELKYLALGNAFATKTAGKHKALGPASADHGCEKASNPCGAYRGLRHPTSGPA